MASVSRDQFEANPCLCEFVCAICLNVPLLHDAVTSTQSCQHVFCSDCLNEWSQRSSKCPTCQAGPLSKKTLQVASPLGFRLLGSIHVRCPMSTCTWVGDYRGLDDHLTNSDNHNSDKVTELKTLGNERFAAGKFDDALKFYSKAILNPQATDDSKAVLFGNQAAALLRLSKYAKAADSCRQAVELGNCEAKIFIRWSQALTQAGRFEEAVKVLAMDQAPKELVFQHKQRCSGNLKVWSSMLQASDEEQFEKAKGLAPQLLQDPWTSQCSKVSALVALVEAHVGNVDTALKLSLDACRASPDDELVWVARAHALLSQGQFDDARRAAKQALRLSPDDKRGAAANRRIKSVESQVLAVRDLADRHEWKDAIQGFHDLDTGNILPKTSPLRIQLLAERGYANFNAGMYDEGLRDADQAIAQKDDCQRAWLTRLYCLRKLQRYQEAVSDARSLLKRWGNGDALIRGAAEKCEFDLRKSMRPDLYQVLGVSQLASELEIKQKYKQKVLLFHPDKLSPDAAEEQKKAAEENFKLLGLALEILGNADSRALWDKGYDGDAIKEELTNRKRPHH